MSTLNSEINQALKDPEIQDIYSKAGLITSAEMQKFIDRDIGWWKKAVGSISLQLK